MRRSLFTLIELLTVVVIMTVLVSLLLPSLAKVREMAKRTKCQGNLKQQGAAFAMYADEWQGYWPNPNCNPSGYHFWYIYLAPYANAKYSSKNVMNSAMTSNYWCPSWKINEPPNLGYGMNFFIPPMTGWSCVFSSTYPKMNGSRSPSLQALTADSGDYHLGNNAGDVIFGFHKFDIYRHTNGANINFCDLHVEWRPANAIVSNQLVIYRGQ